MSVGAVNKQTGDRIPTAGMPAIDDELSLSSTNPVQNAIITAALANKQNATDNSLQTTDKTVVGAINEHEGDIDSLKSGLTNYEATTNAALSVPEDSGKNLFSGSFTTTTNGGVTFTANSNGTVSATNTSTGYASVNSTEFTLKKGQYIFSGVPSGNAKYVLALYANNVVLSQIANGSSVTINLDSDTALVMRCVINGAGVETGVDFEPMIRPSYVTDATYAPYIPSVESRIEAVENGLVKITKESFEQITVNAGSKKFVTNVGLLTDNVVVTAYSDNSDVIAYVATATTTYQVYLYNPTNAAITSNITVMVAKV